MLFLCAPMIVHDIERAVPISMIQGRVSIYTEKLFYHIPHSFPSLYCFFFFRAYDFITISTHFFLVFFFFKIIPSYNFHNAFDVSWQSCRTMALIFLPSSAFICYKRLQSDESGFAKS